MQQPMEVLTSMRTVEWFTPPDIIEKARRVLTAIDLDPASSAVPQQWIRAQEYYKPGDGSLERNWYGRVWLNPPFANTQPFVDHLIEQFAAENVTEALLLVNSNLGYKWFEELWVAYPVCCIRERMKFIPEHGSKNGQAKRAQCVVLFHRSNVTLDRFCFEFNPLGRILLPEKD